jgi:hypothetical protein
MSLIALVAWIGGVIVSFYNGNSNGADLWILAMGD